MDEERLARALGGDTRALARVISEVEDGTLAGRSLLRSLFPRTGRARVIGLTGPPGVGKSSLTDRLTARYRAAGLRVGVIAVDPSSPFSGGALLGDRIRMAGHFTDPGVFIRSMATRGHLGGLSSATADVADVLDAAGYDLVLVETIGVGQEDIEVARVAHLVLLVLAPGLGDEIQVMKSGIMEIGDLFVVNKADLAGADRAEAALHAVLSIAGLEEQRPILRVTAATGDGIEALALALDAAEERLGAEELKSRRTLRARERVAGIVRASLLARSRLEAAPRALWDDGVEAVVSRRLDPYAAAQAIVEAVMASATAGRIGWC